MLHLSMWVRRMNGTPRAVKTSHFLFLLVNSLHFVPLNSPLFTVWLEQKLVGCAENIWGTRWERRHVKRIEVEIRVFYFVHLQWLWSTASQRAERNKKIQSEGRGSAAGLLISSAWVIIATVEIVGEIKLKKRTKEGNISRKRNSMIATKRRWAKKAERRGRYWGRKAKSVRVHLCRIWDSTSISPCCVTEKSTDKAHECMDVAQVLSSNIKGCIS